MTTLTPEQQSHREKNISWIRKSLQLIANEIQEKIKEGNTNYTQIDVDTLCSAYVSYLDNFASIREEWDDTRWGKINKHYKITLSREKINEDDRKFPYDKCNLTPNFMHFVAPRLSYRKHKDKIDKYGDYRDIIINSIESDGNEIIMCDFDLKYRSFDDEDFDDDDAPPPSKVNDRTVPGLR
jgi:hypothetical protein